MEYIICNLCGHSETKQCYQVQDYNYGLPGVFTIVQCRNCGLVYLNPRPTQGEISSFYPESRYHPFKAIHGAGTTVPGSTHWQRALWLSRRTEVGSVLDVGCGSGQFLLAMDALGWNCVGVEPNETAAQHARDAAGLEVLAGDIFAINQVAIYDVITLWDVLEHVHSPYDVLVHCNRLLNLDGVIALHVPNWASIERRLFGERWTALDTPRHLYHFSPETIKHLLKRSGFRVKTLQAKAPVLTLASNVLRWAGDRLYRQGRPKVHMAKTQSNGKSSPRRLSLIQLVQILMRPPNAVANLLNMGASMLVLAQKER